MPGATVLVTAPTLAEPAQQLLRDAGHRIVFMEPPVDEAALLRRLADGPVDAIVLRGSPPITARVLAAAPSLQVVAKNGAGVDSVDLAAARERGVAVAVAAGANADAVAEHALALMLALVRELPSLDCKVRAGAWEGASWQGRDFRGSVVGIVGYGAIGRATVKLAAALGAQVVVLRREGTADGHACETDLHALLPRVDILSLHCPLTDATRGLLGAREFALMRQGALLVNTARGAVVDEAALVEALRSGQLAGAGLDTFAAEPLPPGSPLRELPQVILTPHVAGVTRRSALQVATTTARNVVDVLAGRPLPAAHVVVAPGTTSASDSNRETTMSHPSMSASRRRALAASAAPLVLAAVPWQAAQAQAAFPGKTITFVVPYPAGGANDMLGRLIGQKMGEALGTTALIDNKPGAGALLGAGIVARAPADGNTLLVGGLATHAASPNLLKADYDPVTAFEPVGMIGRAPIIVITSNESPYKTLKDVVDAARKDPQAVMYGSSGNGSPLHLAGEQFMAISRVQMTHVPYKGGNAHIMDLIGGRVPVIFDTATNSMPLLKAGKVRALAVGMPTRLPDLPNVPTFAEAGYPQFEFTAWYALFAPAKTPKDVVGKLSAALAKSLKQPDVVDKLGAVGVTVADGDAASLAKFVPGEYERVGQLIRTAKIKAD